MIAARNSRKFEIPYNFDPDFLKGLALLEIPLENVDFIYMMPHPSHYIGVNREGTDKVAQMSLEEYESHIELVKSYFPNKLQLLLQKPHNQDLMTPDVLQYYIDLGFSSFCCGSIDQAKIIKNINPNFIVIGSITMHITREKLINNIDYGKYFDYFVLDFSYSKDIQKLKLLPIGFKYIILANAVCNSSCDGTHHWFQKDLYAPVDCPGLLQHTGFNSSCLIRPMDLKYFDPYISIFKISDRAWPTWEVLRDLVLYTTDYSYYPGIIYDEDLYEVNS